MREKLQAFVANNPNHHTVPILRAMMDRGYHLRAIRPGGTARYDVQDMTCMVMIDDSGAFGPDGFHRESLAYLVRGADCIILNTAPANRAACELLADGPSRFGRTILIDTIDTYASEWLDYLNDTKREDAGVVAMLPDNTPSVH